MLAYLTGSLVAKATDSVVLDVHDVGYRIGIAEDVGEIGSKITLHLAEIIREDRHDLYGFLSPDALVLFGALTSVQGVGPKVGMKIMASGSGDALRRYILNGDVDFFTSISGVGKKTAQKIILDLKGVLVESSLATKSKEENTDVLDALLSLGYTKETVAGVIEHIQGTSAEDRIKSALRILGRR